MVVEENMSDIILKAVENGQTALSEHDSKNVLTDAGIPSVRQGLAASSREAAELADEIGYPVVMKGCSDKFLHKTEMGLVKLNIKDKDGVLSAYDEITSRGLEMDGVLVMEMVRSEREFVVGLSRDPQFGPYVMFGLGGIYTEVLNDVSFRVAPLRKFDAHEMIKEIKAKKLLEEFRGMPPVDIDALADLLIRVGRLGMENDAIAEIDINPLVLKDDVLIAVDAMIVLNR